MSLRRSSRTEISPATSADKKSGPKSSDTVVSSIADGSDVIGTQTSDDETKAQDFISALEGNASSTVRCSQMPVDMKSGEALEKARIIGGTRTCVDSNFSSKQPKIKSPSDEVNGLLGGGKQSLCVCHPA